jgi:hypothetical protein
MDGGARENAARAYLAPALNRPNLDVLVETLVTKVVQTGTENGLPVFKGIEFSQSTSGGLSLMHFQCCETYRGF